MNRLHSTAKSAALIAAVVAALTQRADAQVCTYNDAATSFGATYTNNQQSSATPVSCTAGSTTTGARLNNTSYGRSVITAPLTGDFKFLARKSSQSNAAPAFGMVASLSPETKQFPDSTIQAPAGGGCNDPSVTTGINAIERNLHRSWPLFGKTYYYGDYNANPPNDPATVTTATSPYVKWAPFNSAPNTPLAGGDEYIYMDPANDSAGGSDLYGWGPKRSGTVRPAGGGAYPLMSPGHTDGCADAGLTAAEKTACRTCLDGKGYYLQDGAVAGDLKKSVFKGYILNDFPPAWTHLSWAFGFVLNFQLKDASNNPLFPIVRDQYQSNNSPQCPSQANINHAGGSFEPVGSADCSIAYPTYDWPKIQALGMGPITNDQANMQGDNAAWGAMQPFAGTQLTGNTPAGDMLMAAQVLQNWAQGACSACQSKTILYLGFGIPCAEDKPTGMTAPALNPACTGECNYTNPAAQCRCGLGTTTNWLPQTANFMYNSMGIRSYFIGMGPHTDSMRRAAAEARGKYFDGRNVTMIHDALLSTLTDIIATATSSATSTVNAVQVSVAGQEELVPRFVATADQGIWEGHVFKYYLFSEFAANCSKAGDLVKVPNPAQPVCDATCVCPGGSCTGRWLVDRECKLITPDKTGFLYQATWNGTALIVPPPAACTTNADCGGKTCNVVTKTCPPNAKPAVPVWDAAEQIRQTNWYQRSVYTAIDTNNDGVINSSDGDISSPAGMYLITAGAVAGNKDLSGGVSDVVADALAPYMALDGPTTCGDIEVKLGTSFPAATPRLRACARAVLNYALGEDLLNEYQIGASDANYRIINRIGMLGDVFHSSPQDIGPPINESDCTTGINTRRCVTTLFNNKPTNGLPDYQPLEKPGQVADPASGVMVANTANVDAYQAYYLDETFRLKRPRAMVFGANDGMLHAIQTACFVKATTSGGVTTAEYWDGPGMGSCIAGSQPNGSELWGFIAPDLLPKLALMMLGKHQFFVDGSPMVRDIYAPTGTAASTKRYTNTAPATMDFKRIAIFGEREGGTHWFGLDVTDPTWPSFRWTFPQPNTADELSVGQSWGDWVPNAPPIVPVRIAAPTPSTGFPTYLDSSGLAQAFQEKWVVLLPGGYDPYGAAGKRIYMLDAYSGQKIFQTNDTATIKQDFSFAALPSAIAWGTQVLANPPTYNNGYFDTAVYGDMGGQIWTLRFNDVGTMTAGLVSNWNFGRAFRQFAAEDTGSAPYKMQHRTPVFSMISAARMSEGALRVFLGTGDRANAGENGLGQCSIYNPLACGKNKCVMTTATNAWLGATGSRSPEMSTTSSFQGDIGATYTSSTTNTFTSAAAVCSPAVTEVNSCVSCANATTGNKAATPASPGEPQYACTNTSTGWKCSVRTISETLASDRLEAATGTLTPDPNGDIGYFSRFLGFNLFDNNLTKPRAIFTATATTYDTNALTETSLTDLFAANTPKTFSASGNTSVSAKVNGLSNGFYFSYPVLDERTATNSLLLQNCLSWYTIQPGQECMTNADCSSGTCNTTTHTCVAPVACGSSSTVIPARTAFLYQINASDGSTNCGLTSSTYIRTAAPLNSFLVPPPPPQQLVSTNKSGQMQFSIIAPAGQLSPSASAASGGASTPFSFFYTLGMPRELEQCRHTSSANACY